MYNGIVDIGFKNVALNERIRELKVMLLIFK